MKDSLKAGLAHQFKFKIPPTKTVPHLYPESESFRQMPEVLATGYLVGLLEWACIEALRPHLDWPREQSVGTRIDVSHLAATPPGMTVTVDVRLVRVEGRKLSFTVSAHDGGKPAACRIEALTTRWTGLHSGSSWYAAGWLLK